MKPLYEKIAMTALSAGLAMLAYLVADDEAVRSLLLFLAGGPAGGALYPRARERELERRVRESLPPQS